MDTFNPKIFIRDFLTVFLMDCINMDNAIMTPKELECFASEEGRKMLEAPEKITEHYDEKGVLKGNHKELEKALKNNPLLYLWSFSNVFAKLNKKALNDFYIAKALLKNDRQAVAEIAGITDGRYDSVEKFNTALEEVICDRFFNMTDDKMENYN